MAKADHAVFAFHDVQAPSLLSRRNVARWAGKSRGFVAVGEIFCGVEGERRGAAASFLWRET